MRNQVISMRLFVQKTIIFAKVAIKYKSRELKSTIISGRLIEGMQMHYVMTRSAYSSVGGSLDQDLRTSY